LNRLAASLRAPLASLHERTPEFTAEEVSVALELIDAGLGGSPDYRFWIDVDEEQVVRGYICFGKTPMTEGTYDLYWIAVEPEQKVQGIGRGLVVAMEHEIATEGAYLVRVETAGAPAYEPTRAFYDRIGYEVVARVRDFYARGNDLLVYGHYLSADDHAPDTLR
jgi:ribosomal protein S18 acetylase RimI-like enzyme